MRASELIRLLNNATEDHGDLIVTFKNREFGTAEEITDINIYCDDVSYPLFVKKNKITSEKRQK